MPDRYRQTYLGMVKIIKYKNKISPNKKRFDYLLSRSFLGMVNTIENTKQDFPPKKVWSLQWMMPLERWLLLSKRPTCEQRTKIEQIGLKLTENDFAALKKKKCRCFRFEKTVIVFLSDNGGPTGRAGRAANNWPLRGGKVEAFKKTDLD